MAPIQVRVEARQLAQETNIHTYACNDVHSPSPSLPLPACKQVPEFVATIAQLCLLAHLNEHR